MRKISQSRALDYEHHTPSTETMDTQPRRIAGATISSWSGSLAIDLSALLARRPPDLSIGGVSIGGGPSLDAPGTPTAPSDRTAAETVSLSDGTQITFATANQFEAFNNL